MLSAKWEWLTSHAMCGFIAAALVTIRDQSCILEGLLTLLLCPIVCVGIGWGVWRWNEGKW
jgi:hypothetical protein